MSPLASWALLIGLIVAGCLLVDWVLRIDDRDFDVEVPEPPSNVTVVEPLPVLVGCHCDECAPAVDLAAIRMLPETGVAG